MPSFDDIDEIVNTSGILNTSGVMTDAVTADAADATTTTAAPGPGMHLSVMSHRMQLLYQHRLDFVL